MSRLDHEAESAVRQRLGDLDADAFLTRLEQSGDRGRPDLRYGRLAVRYRERAPDRRLDVVVSGDDGRLVSVLGFLDKVPG